MRLVANDLVVRQLKSGFERTPARTDEQEKKVNSGDEPKNTYNKKERRERRREEYPMRLVAASLLELRVQRAILSYTKEKVRR